jgi:hypothetical protein
VWNAAYSGWKRVRFEALAVASDLEQADDLEVHRPRPVDHRRGSRACRSLTWMRSQRCSNRLMAGTQFSASDCVSTVCCRLLSPRLNSSTISTSCAAHGTQGRTQLGQVEEQEALREGKVRSACSSSKPTARTQSPDSTCGAADPSTGSTRAPSVWPQISSCSR